MSLCRKAEVDQPRHATDVQVELPAATHVHTWHNLDIYVALLEGS